MSEPARETAAQRERWNLNITGYVSDSLVGLFTWKFSRILAACSEFRGLKSNESHVPIKKD